MRILSKKSDLIIYMISCVKTFLIEKNAAVHRFPIFTVCKMPQDGMKIDIRIKNSNYQMLIHNSADTDTKS